RCPAVPRPEPEEGGAVPAGARDEPRDLRQTPVALTPIGETARHGGDGLGRAAPCPRQGRAGAEAVGRGERADRVATRDCRRQPFELTVDRRRETAELPGLQVPGNGVEETLAARTESGVVA